MNKKKTLIGFLLMIFLGPLGTINAAIVNFENLYTDELSLVFVPTLYEGFKWNTMSVYTEKYGNENPAYLPLIVGQVSGVVYQHGGGFSAPESGSFDLLSFSVSSVYTQVQFFNVIGYRDGNEIYNNLLVAKTDFDLNTPGHQNISYNIDFNGIDEVRFWAATTAHLVIDNIAYENFTGSPVPVPAAIWLLGSGLIGLVGFRKKNNKSL